MTEAALRPRSNSEIVDAGFQLTREHFGPLAILAAVITIPGLVVALVAAHVAPPQGETTAALANQLLVLSPLLLISTCWFFIGIGALMHMSAAAYRGAAVEPGAALRAALSRAPSLIAGNLLAYLLVFGLFLLGALVSTLAIAVASAAGMAVFGRAQAGTGRTALVMLATLGIVGGGLAGMFVGAARYLNVTAAVMLERSSAIASLTRSAQLSLGHRKRIVGLVMLGFAILFVVVVGALALLQSVTQNAVLVNVLSNLVWIPLYPLVANILTVVYYDLRIRKEGYDIEELSRRLGADAG